MKYRSRMDIAADILKIGGEGAIKTRIMHRAFLSHPQLKEYLGLLADAGFLEYQVESKKYYTTAKGRHFVKVCDELGELIEPFPLRAAVAR